MKKYVENMKKYVENMKEYADSGTRKNGEIHPTYWIWDLNSASRRL